jgi:hypothetical protein
MMTVIGAVIVFSTFESEFVDVQSLAVGGEDRDHLRNHVDHGPEFGFGFLDGRKCARQCRLSAIALDREECDVAGPLDHLDLVCTNGIRVCVVQAERSEHVAVLRQERNRPGAPKAVLQCDRPVLLRGTGPERVGGDILIDDALLPKRRCAARPHGRADRDWRDELLPALGYSSSGLWPEPPAIRICEQNARNQVWIEGVYPVAQSVQDGVQRGALDDQFKRLLMDDRQRITNGR